MNNWRWSLFCRLARTAYSGILPMRGGLTFSDVQAEGATMEQVESQHNNKPTKVTIKPPSQPKA